MLLPRDAKTVLFDQNARVVRLLRLLGTAGEEARLVGGAVRNALLGAAVHEFDVATTALPEDVMARAAADGLKTVPTGIAHGTVTVIVSGEAFEVTSLREDIETDGRRAVVRFGRDFKIDALRRDFTINALSVGLDGRIHDYTGGLKDISARCVRFIGDPKQRIREDYLRILRFFRFSAAYARGALDPGGLSACLSEREGLACLSKERIGQEMRKLIMAEHAAEVLGEAPVAGLLEPLCGGRLDVPRFARLSLLETECGVERELVRRIAGLVCDSSEDMVSTVRDALKLSNAERDRMLAILRAGGYAHEFVERLQHVHMAGSSSLIEAVYRVGASALVDALLLRAAEKSGFGEVAALGHLIEGVSTLRPPSNPFSGGMFVSLGIKPGAAMGAARRRAEAAWIAAGFPEDAQAIRTLAQLAVRSAK